VLDLPFGCRATRSFEHTGATVQDMDGIRRALGKQKINFYVYIVLRYESWRRGHRTTRRTR
jgi:hypothetical protein